MPGIKKKLLIGLGGTAGFSLAAWRTYFPWLRYDLQLISMGKEMAKRTAYDMEHLRFIIDMFEEKIEKFGSKPLLIHDDRIYTYEFMNKQASKVANIAIKLGLKMGDTVALFFQNDPSYVWTFLGLQKLGISVALINNNLRGQALLHCLQVSEAKIVIIGQGDEHVSCFEMVRDRLDIPVYFSGIRTTDIPPHFHSWDDLMINSSSADICKNVREGLSLATTFCYIFTSGTTGLPKPAIITQAKGISISKFLVFAKGGPSDVVYTTTPLYHVAANMALFSAIDVGATLVLKTKFSAKQYWDDIRRYNVTFAQYIGELCRYLVLQPESPNDGVHKLKVAFGNGLRMDIWDKFQKKFKVPRIMELYGATEGPVGTINVSGRIGACGRLSPLLRLGDPLKKYIIKYDPIMEEPLRTKEGRCIRCKAGEVGLLIAEITNANISAFYKGKKELNDKKVLYNVFKEGDKYFNYGDLLYHDTDYFMYFVDRVGDTFRWKGENVSTTEVANILTGLDFIQDANVYGVQIPGSDGRAGMAAILLDEDTAPTSDVLKKIYQYCEESLPAYARPLILRFIKEMPLTSTLKQKKVEYKKESYDPSLISEPLYHISRAKKTYEPLTAQTLPTFLQSRL